MNRSSATTGITILTGVRIASVETRTSDFSIPCAFGLAALGGPIVTMLFHPESGLPLTEGIMQAGALMIILYALSTLTTAILQGLGKLKEPMIHCAIALAAHVVMLVVLLREFDLNIYAVLYANAFFAAIVCVLNAITIKRVLGYRQELVKTFLIPLVSSAIMAFVSYGFYHLLHLFLGVTISTIFSIVAAVLIYAFAMVALKGITAEEIVSFPKGTLILKIFRKFGLLR